MKDKNLNKKEVSSISLNDIVSITEKICSRVDVIRFEEAIEHLEVSLYIECDTFEQVQKVKEKLLEFDDKIQMTFIDNNAGNLI